MRKSLKIARDFAEKQRSERAKRIEQIVQRDYVDEDTGAADLAYEALGTDASLTDNEIARRIAQLILQP